MSSASTTTESSTRREERFKLTVELASPERIANINFALPNLLVVPRFSPPTSHLQLPRRVALNGIHGKPKLGVPLRMLTALNIWISLGRLPVQRDLRVWILFIERVTIVEVLGLEDHDDQRSEFLAHGRIMDGGVGGNGRWTTVTSRG